MVKCGVSMDERDETGDHRRLRLRRILIVADVVYALLLAVAWFPAAFSMMYASGGTDLRVYIQVYSLLTFPFVLVFAMIVPWIFYRLHMPMISKALLMLPTINIALILLFVLIPAWAA